TLRDGLNRRERIVELVAHHANQALPGLALFIAEGAAQIAEHHEVMRQAGLPKQTASHAPAAGTSRKSELHGARRVAFERCAETEFRGGEAEQAFGRTGEQSLTGAI